MRGNKSNKPGKIWCKYWGYGSYWLKELNVSGRTKKYEEIWGWGNMKYEELVKSNGWFLLHFRFSLNFPLFLLISHNDAKSSLVCFRNFASLWEDKGKSTSEQDLFLKCVLPVSWVQKDFAFEIYIFSRS